MIPFPCPKKHSEFTTVSGGLHCSDCDKTILDLVGRSSSEIDQVKKNNPSACVIMNERNSKVEKFGVKRFALALIIVMGSSGFVFSNQELKENLASVKNDYLAQTDSLNNINVAITNKEGEARYAWVKIICENDSVLTLVRNDEYGFSIKLGEEYEGQKLIVEVAPSKGRAKREVIESFDSSEFYYFNFSYSNKKFYRRIVGGSF